MIVTNGTVEYGRTVRPADFESKSAKVSLSFAIEEGSDPAAAAAQVMDMAMAEVHRRLGLEVPKPAPGVPETRPTVVPAEPATSVTSMGNSHTPSDTGSPAPGVPEAHPTNPAPEDGPFANLDPAAVTAPVEEPLVLDTPVIITDKDVQHAVFAAIERKVGNADIADLVTKVHDGVPGKRMSQFDQRQRIKFLAELKKLGPAA